MGLLSRFRRPKSCGTLVLIRHGETTWDAEGKFTGWADPHLSEAGKSQVDEAARALQASGYTFDVAYTSMLKRAVETTWLLLKELNLIHVPVIKDHKLNDRSYGALTGHSVAEFQEAYGAETVQSWRRSQSARPPAFQPDHPYDPASTGRYARWEDRDGNRQAVSLPQGESLADAVDRCEPCWEAISKDLLAGKNVLVAAHGNSIRGLIQAIDGVPAADIGKVEIPACLPLVYRFERSAESGELVPLQGECYSGTARYLPLSGEFLAEPEELKAAQASTREASLRRYGFAGYAAPASARGADTTADESEASAASAWPPAGVWPPVEAEGGWWRPRARAQRSLTRSHGGSTS